jgi:hypothetical protein
MKTAITRAFLWVLMGLPMALLAQKSIRDSSITFTFVNSGYEALLTGGDMADRFGFTNGIGVEVGVKFSSNFYVYGGGKFLFGTDVRERVAQNVTFTEVYDGEEHVFGIGTDGRAYRVLFMERGFTIPVMVGKVIPISPKKSPNGGLYVEAGVQFLEHRIRIENQGNRVPALSPEWRKGYDRLSNGFGFAQGVGYKFLSRSRYLNFSVGLHAVEAFTQNRRSLNYDTGVRDNSQRLDVLYGFKFGWTLLIYQEAPEKEYYY